jgi:hypothetical protein
MQPEPLAPHRLELSTASTEDTTAPPRQLEHWQGSDAATIRDSSFCDHNHRTGRNGPDTTTIEQDPHRTTTDDDDGKHSNNEHKHSTAQHSPQQHSKQLL